MIITMNDTTEIDFTNVNACGVLKMGVDEWKKIQRKHRWRVISNKR